jgi:mxaD protein
VRTETVAIDIATDPDAVWALVGDFGTLDRWMAGVDACTLDGDVRTVQTMGMTIRERLTARDDADRSITYSIVDGAPCEAHSATVRVTDGPDDGAHVTWEVSIEPDEMAPLFRDIYQGSLDHLKATLEP